LISAFCFLLGFVTCGITWFIWAGVSVWGLIEGIMILTGSMNKDAQGLTLKD
jgi:hypothetical protein